MSQIKEIVKSTLLQLKAKGLEATPDNYFEEFYKQSKRLNEKIKECTTFETISRDLHLNNKKNINNYHQLLLRVIDDKEDEKSLKKLAMTISQILSPSVHYDIEDEISTLSKALSNNPLKLLQRDTVASLKKITKQRIKNDRLVVKDKADDINKLTKLLSKQFEATILTSQNSSDEILEIKNELENLNISQSSARELGALQSKLIETVCDFESVVNKHKLEIAKGKSNLNNLEETITKLHDELNSANEEKIIDYLTNVLNRRALDNEFEKIEKKRTIFNSSYAIVFYDIDHFKKINDVYGHDCGDAVLRTFAAILKNLTRAEDTVGRYGGEEFIVLLNYDNTREIIKYINRVKELVQTSDFNYKNEKVDIKFSAGVSYRANYQTHFEAIQKADELLYQAKKQGRDRVIIEDGTVI